MNWLTNSRAGCPGNPLIVSTWPYERDFIVPPGQGRRLDLGNFEAVVLATSAPTSGEVTLLQTQSEPPEFGPPLHLHRDAAEAFFVLEGEYMMCIEEQRTLCPPGTFVYVPRATPRTFKVSEGPGKVPEGYL